MTIGGSAQFTARTGASWADPFTMYDELRDLDPVHHVADGDYWVLSRHADVFDAVRDHETFSSEQGLTFTYGEIERLGIDAARPLVMTDPPQHTALRRRVARAFTPRMVAGMEGPIRRFVADRLARLAREPGPVDIVERVFKPLPSMVVAHFLGVPEQDRGRFDGWTDAVVAANATGDPLAAIGAVAEMFGYFTELVEHRRREPGEDTISQLVSVEPDAPAVELSQILGFAFTMVTGGNDTTTGMLGGAAVLLDEHRDQRRLLAEDPELVADAVEEILRLTSPVQGLARTTTRPVTLHGTTIPAQRKVLLLYASANRDPREFGSDAGEFDVLRRPRRTLAFGYGAHHCLGAAVARLQGRVALEELLHQMGDFAIDPDSVVYAPGHFVRRPEHIDLYPRGR